MVSDLDWDNIASICDDFTECLSAHERAPPPKKQAANYLGHADITNLKKPEARKLRAKTQKLKRSQDKATKAQDDKLVKQVRSAFNFQKKI